MLKDVVAKVAASGSRAPQDKSGRTGAELEDQFSNETLRQREVNARGDSRAWLARRRRWFQRGNGR